MALNIPLDTPYIDLKRGRLNGLIHFQYLPIAECLGAVFECQNGCTDEGQSVRWLVPTHMLLSYHTACPSCHSANVEFLEFFKTIPDSKHWLWDFSTI